MRLIIAAAYNGLMRFIKQVQSSRGWLFGLFGLCWLSCGMSAPSSLAEPSLDSLHLIRVPATRQATEYTCGAAAVQAVLGYYGEDNCEHDVAKALRTNATDGTNYGNIAEVVRRKGYTVVAKTGMTIDDLERAMRAGSPALCLIQAWSDHHKNDYASDWNDGHYVVAIGSDSDNLYFMDPWVLGHYTFIPKQEFLTRWHDKEHGTKLNHLAIIISKSATSFDPNQLKKTE